MERNKYIQFEEEDKKMIEEFESIEHKPAEDKEELMKAIQEAAKNYSRKDKVISIRISNQTLEKIKAKASNAGLPYQTLISSVLHQIANKKIKFEI